MFANVASCMAQNSKLLLELHPERQAKLSDSVGKKGKKRKAAEVDGAPKKKRTTGYLMFTIQERKNLASGMKPSETMKELGVKWQALTEEQRKGWSAKALAENQAGEGGAPELNVPAPASAPAEGEKKKKKKKKKKDAAAPAAVPAANADEAERKQRKEEKKRKKAAAATGVAVATGEDGEKKKKKKKDKDKKKDKAT
jgi:hypothetical protein